jgi:hypothetical protein
MISTDYISYNEEEPTLMRHSVSSGASLSVPGVRKSNSSAVDRVEQQSGGVCDVLIATFASFVGYMALASVGAAAAAMYVEASIITYVAFSFPIILAPVVIYQKSRLELLPSKFSLSKGLFRM